MRGVNEAPALIDIVIRYKPFNWTLAVSGFYFFNFRCLFGDVNVKRIVAVQGDLIGQAFRTDRAQGMRRDTDCCIVG